MGRGACGKAEIFGGFRTEDGLKNKANERVLGQGYSSSSSTFWPTIVFVTDERLPNINLCIAVFCFFYHHFYFPAQLAGAVTLSDLLDKQWSLVSSFHPPTGNICVATMCYLCFHTYVIANGVFRLDFVFVVLWVRRRVPQVSIISSHKMQALNTPPGCVICNTSCTYK